MSDAVGKNFDFKSSADRMRVGYTFIMFCYDDFTVARVLLSADGYGITLREPGKLEQRILYSEFIGLVLGAVCSTFTCYQKIFGDLAELGLDRTDCFSLLSHHRSYDFGTHSDSAKYDIYQVFTGYFSAVTRANSPNLPLLRRDFIIYRIQSKLKEMAEFRYLSVKELLLVTLI